MSGYVVSVQIVGNDSAFQSAMARVSAANAAAAKGLAATGRQMEAMGRTMTHAVTVPVLAAGVAATKMAYDFQTAVTKVTTLSTGYGQSAAQISASVLKVSRDSGIAATDLANALYPVASSGYTAAQSMDILTRASKMSAVGMGDAATVTDALTSTINAYGIQNLSAAKAADVFAGIVQNSKFAPAELAGELGKVLPLASTLKESFADLGGALAAMSHHGLDATTSTTALRQIFAEITKPSAGAAKEAEKLGLNWSGLAKDLATNGILPTLQEIGNAAQKAGDKSKLSTEQWQGVADNLGITLKQAQTEFKNMDLGALGKMFPNIRALTGTLALLNDQSGFVKRSFDNVKNSTGALDGMFQKYAATSNGKIKLALNDLKVALIEVGDKLLPKVAEWVGKVAAWWDKLSPKTKENAEHFAVMAAEIGPILLVGGKLVKLLSSLMKMNPWALLLVGLTELYINSKGFRDVVNDLVGWMKKLDDNTGLVRGAMVLLGGTFVALKLMDVAKGFQAIAAGETAAAGAAGAAGGAGLLGRLGAVAVAAGGLGVAGALGLAAVGVKMYASSGDAATAKGKNLAAQTAALDAELRVLTGGIQGTASHMKDFGFTNDEVQQKINDFNTAHPTQQLSALQVQAINTANALIFPPVTIGVNTAPGINSLDALTGAALTAAQAVRMAAGLTTNPRINDADAAGLAAQDAAIANRGATINAAPVKYHTVPLAGGGKDNSGGSKSGGGSKTSDAAKKAAAAAAANIKKLTSETQSYTKQVTAAQAAYNAAVKTGNAQKIAAAQSLLTVLTAQKTTLQTALDSAKNKTIAVDASFAKQKAGAPLLSLAQMFTSGLAAENLSGPVETAATKLAATITKQFADDNGTVPAAIQASLDKLNQLAQEAGSFRTTFADALNGGGDFVSTFKGTGASGTDIKAYLQNEVVKIQHLGADMAILSKRGLPPSLMKMLAAGGLDAVDVADALVNSSATDFSSIIGLSNQVTSLSNSLAGTTENRVFGGSSDLAGKTVSGTVNAGSAAKGGITVNVTANTNANPSQIGQEIAWQLKTVGV